MGEQIGALLIKSKKILVILVKSELIDGILMAINKEVGLNKPGQGIVFSMLVHSVVGLGE